jgi:hypothetical protein
MPMPIRRSTCLLVVSPAVNPLYRNAAHEVPRIEAWPEPSPRVPGYSKAPGSEDFLPEHVRRCRIAELLNAGYLCGRNVDKLSIHMSAPMWALITYRDGGYRISSPVSSHHFGKFVKTLMVESQPGYMGNSHSPS